MFKKIFFLFLFFQFLNNFTSYSQNILKIDSLESVITTTTNDTIRMNTYNLLRRETYYTNPVQSQKYANLFFETAQKLKDSLHMAFANYYLGNTYVTQTNYKKALDHFFKAANYFEKVKDSSRLSSMYNGIGAAYENNGNDSLSLKYFKKAQVLSSSQGDLRRSALALNNIGNIYKNRNDYQKAQYFMEEAVKQINTTNNFQYINLLSLNLANLYTDLEHYNKAENIYYKILKQTDTVNDLRQYATLLRGLGNVNIAQNNYKKGLNYLHKAYSIFGKANFFDDQFNMTPDLINAYKTNKKFKKGLDLFQIYNEQKDSIFSVEKDKNLTEALQKYETEKKDAQLKVLTLETEKEAQQKRLFSYLAILGILIAGIIGFFLYKNQKKNALLAKQKKLLEATVDEKNVLLKETHHRVKNSFQIVASLLYLQSESMEDKEAKLAIQEAQNRVRSMVLIHQKLYSKDQLVGIDTQEYLEDLTRDIFESHQFEGNKINYHLAIQSLVLGIETITPMGLIVNELITNVIKHAFPKITPQSSIHITLKKENKTLVLQVADNGKGMPDKINESSFGIKLIKALAKKLKATLSYAKNTPTGTIAIITIHRFTEL